MLSAKIISVLVVVGAIALVCVLTGCSPAPSTVLYQAIGTDTAAVQATTSLYQSGIITKTDAQAIYKGELSADAALKVWDVVAKSGGSTANVASAETAANAALSAILAQLQALQSHSPALAKKMAARRATTPTTAKVVSSAEVISLIELVMQLAPEVETWLNSILNTTTVTQAQIDGALSNLDTALANLATALATSPTTTPTTVSTGN